MTRPSRIRRILKWTGVGLSLLIITTWIASLWYGGVAVLASNCVIGGGEGRFCIIIASVNIGGSYGNGISDHIWKGISFGRPEFEIEHFDLGGEQVVILLPFWLLLLLTAIPTAWLWHRDRRRIRPGCCLRCGYDLTGNTSGVCSECGLPATPLLEKSG